MRSTTSSASRGRPGAGTAKTGSPASSTRGRPEECRAQGREPGLTLLAPSGPANVFCAADPDTFWERYGHHLLADAQGYAAWRAADTASYVRDDSSSVEEMRAAGVYVVLTADQLVEQCRAGDIRLVTSHPACGGLPAEPSWESLRLVCETVLPALSSW